jgi:hypothetical protein
MHSQDLSRTWVGTVGGQLVRADTITGLRCADGKADAFCSHGRLVTLAEPACPADFHLQLLQALGRAANDDRWLLVISPEKSTQGWEWNERRADDWNA